MTMTPIRHLALMLDEASQRQTAIESAEQRGELDQAEWAPASRVWSRQELALSSAIIAEPPRTIYDVLTVLTELAGARESISAQGTQATAQDLRDLEEMTSVAVQNCALRIAALCHPEEEPTESQHQSLEWLSKKVEQRLPKAKDR